MSRTLSLKLALLFLVVLGGEALSCRVRGAEPVRFNVRTRLPDTVTNSWRVVEREVAWNPAFTAVVVCDMWDRHWCPDATERVGEMAPRMNAVIRAARERGMLIIHCPSDTMEFYKDHPGRRLAQSAPKVETTLPLKAWCSVDGTREPPLPIDDTDGGCDGCPDCPGFRAWSRQHPAIEIREGDAITDNAEAFYLMRQRGITNVIVMGVHVNMCVLGRPFSIRQMTYQGQNVLLMRDMTDAMYNHRKAPFVSHVRGTELVVEHIEKHWCGTITSDALVGGEPFRFSVDRPKHVVLLIGENEYQTETTLPAFAAAELAPLGFRVSQVIASPREGDPDFRNGEALRSADVVVVSVRRRTPSAAVLGLLREHVAAGKPVIGIRTASHAFDAKPPGAGYEAWPTFDRDVFGGRYEGHYGNKPPSAPHTVIDPVGSNTQHAVLTGVRFSRVKVTSHLYKNRNLSHDVVPLLQGSVEGRPEVEPVAWVRDGRQGRAFYTSLGNPEDFALPPFRRLLLNAVLWSVGVPIPPARPEPVDYAGRWQSLNVPGTWDETSQGRLSGFDGVAWYRCRVGLPSAWRGQPLHLEVGHVDNAYEAFVNGVRVGSNGAFPPAYQNGVQEIRRHEVPASFVGAAAELTVALRVYDHDGRGGFKGAAPALVQGEERIVLSGAWDFRTGDDAGWALEEGAGVVNALFGATRAAATTAAPSPAPANLARAGAGADAVDLPQEAAGTPLPVAEALRKFRIAPDLEWEPVLSEPDIAQPVFLNFDERSRLWVVEYRQYPHPAGLKMVSRDSVWRAVYDKVPPPPPHHFKGADRITIHEDTDGDGRFDAHKVFLDGLNIVTSVERGRGGVWVLNPPYLLFYRDANQDDLPDGDPEVRLSGFGLEDTHSVANSLRWGPDGWLYGAQGSTVTGNIVVYGPDGKPINTQPMYSQGQNIWRYHPERRKYEVFSEGGGNAFGCEIDSAGRIFSGHNGGDTRGFHYIQGGYLQKGFEKHGPLSNPYAFGYFPPMKHANVPRFTHTFVIYEGGALPPAYDGRLFGVEPIQGRLVLSDLIPARSTFETRDVSRPVVSDDRWFRPVDIKIGPDGALYVCDWYDQQVNHYRNHEGRIDTTNGRIYRLKQRGTTPRPPEDFSRMDDETLAKRLADPNRSIRQTVQRLIADRRATAASVRSGLGAARGALALERLWALHSTGQLDEACSLEALAHPEPKVRLWAARLIGDIGTPTPSQLKQLETLAATDPEIEVRSQLAATARRLAAEPALRLVRALAGRSEDLQDPRLPLQLWWAIEAHCAASLDAVLALFQEPLFWSKPIVEQQLLPRLARRLAQPGTRRELVACGRLFDLAPTPEHSRRLMSGVETAFRGRVVTGLPESLLLALDRHKVGSLAFGLRRGEPSAVTSGLARIEDPTVTRDERIELLGVFGEVRVPAVVPGLIRVLRGAAGDDGLRKAALTALGSYDDPAIADAVISVYPVLGRESLATAQALLSSRAAWSSRFVQVVSNGWSSWSGPLLAPRMIPASMVQRMRSHRDPGLVQAVDAVWPRVAAATSGEMEAKIRRWTAAVREGTGDPYAGRTLFMNNCGVCHRLFGNGGQVGPDLTVFNRTDVESLLLSIVNPGAEIREGYESVSIETRDERSITGFLVEQDSQTVVLRTLDNQNLTVKRDGIASMKTGGASLMPEGLLDALDDQAVRDLFAYLRSTQPLVGEPPRPRTAAGPVR